MMNVRYCLWRGAPNVGAFTSFYEVTTESVLHVLDYLAKQFKILAKETQCTVHETKK